MSKGACILLGIVTFLASLGFLLTGFTLGAELPAGSTPFYVLAVFFATVAAAFLFSASHPVTLRIIGAGLFCASVWYLYGQGVHALEAQNAPPQPPHVAHDNEHSGGTLPGAICCMLFFGLPGAFMAITGKYPTWGRYAAAFSGTQDEAEPSEETAGDGPVTSPATVRAPK